MSGQDISPLEAAASYLASLPPATRQQKLLELATKVEVAPPSTPTRPASPTPSAVLARMVDLEKNMRAQPVYQTAACHFLPRPEPAAPATAESCPAGPSTTTSASDPPHGRDQSLGPSVHIDSSLAETSATTSHAEPIPGPEEELRDSRLALAAEKAQVKLGVLKDISLAATAQSKADPNAALAGAATAAHDIPAVLAEAAMVIDRLVLDPALAPPVLPAGAVQALGVVDLVVFIRLFSETIKIEISKAIVVAANAALNSRRLLDLPALTLLPCVIWNGSANASPDDVIQAPRTGTAIPRLLDVFFDVCAGRVRRLVVEGPTAMPLRPSIWLRLAQGVAAAKGDIIVLEKAEEAGSEGVKATHYHPKILLAVGVSLLTELRAYLVIQCPRDAGEPTLEVGDFTGLNAVEHLAALEFLGHLKAASSPNDYHVHLVIIWVLQHLARHVYSWSRSLAASSGKRKTVFREGPFELDGAKKPREAPPEQVLEGEALDDEILAFALILPADGHTAVTCPKCRRQQATRAKLRGHILSGCAAFRLAVDIAERLVPLLPKGRHPKTA